MVLSRMYVRSSIEQLTEHGYIATIVYSFYGITHFSESQYCASLADARNWILHERCAGVLVETDGTKNKYTYTEQRE